MLRRMPEARRARLRVVGAALLFSTGGAAIKATALSGWQVASLRSGIAALALVLLLPQARRGFGGRSALVALAYAATVVLFVTSNKLTTSAAAIFLQSTAPLYILLLGPWLLREHVRRGDVAVIALVAVGLALMFAGPDAPARTAPDPVRGDLLAVAAGLAWALTLMGLRWMGGGRGGSPLGAVVLGNAFAFVGCLPLALVRLLPQARRGFGGRAALVAVAYAATVVLFVTSNKLTTSAAAIFLQSTAPLYVLLLGPWLLRERARRGDVAVIALVAVGLALMFVGPDAPARTAPDPVRGDLLAVAAGLAWALTIMGLRWMGGGRGGSPLGAVVLGNAFAFAGCLPLALPLAGATPRDWAALAYLGVFQIAAAYVLLTSAVRHVPALQVSLLVLVEPALNPVWSWLAHGERPGPFTLVGGALVLGATAAKGWIDARAAARAAPAAGVPLTPGRVP